MTAAIPRQPLRFRERVLLQFRSAQNTDYLRRELASHLTPEIQDAVLRNHVHDVLRFATTFGQGGTFFDDDPLAQRGRRRRGTDLWEEVRRLNRAYIAQRLRHARTVVEKKARLQKPTKDRLAPALLDESEDDEPLYYRLFVADSLRPPGLENLNGPGPLWALNEDQYARSRAGPGPLSRSENFSRPNAPGRSENFVPQPGQSRSDMPWEAGRASRTAEQAVAEYYGSADPTGNATTSVLLSAETAGFITQGGKNAGRVYDVNGDYSAHNRGLGLNGFATRFERREQIPYWQRGGHRPQLYSGRSWDAGTPWDRSDGQPLERAWNPAMQKSEVIGDHDETLGSGSDEWGGNMVGQVRGWDMRRLRHPQGEQYRASAGPNIGHNW